MYEIRFLESALEDLKGIVSYIAHTLNNPIATEKLSKEEEKHEVTIARVTSCTKKYTKSNGLGGFHEQNMLLQCPAGGCPH